MSLFWITTNRIRSHPQCLLVITTQLVSRLKILKNLSVSATMKTKPNINIYTYVQLTKLHFLNRLVWSAWRGREREREREREMYRLAKEQVSLNTVVTKYSDIGMISCPYIWDFVWSRFVQCLDKLFKKTGKWFTNSFPEIISYVHVHHMFQYCYYEQLYWETDLVRFSKAPNDREDEAGWDTTRSGLSPALRHIPYQLYTAGVLRLLLWRNIYSCTLQGWGGTTIITVT